MEQRKIVIATLAVVVILAGAALYMGKKGEETANTQIMEGGEQSGQETATSSYSEERNAEESNESAETEGFAILEKLVDAYPDIDFTKQASGSFEWVTDSGDSPLKLSGMSIQAIGVSSRPDLSGAFEKAGFKEDLDNTADGTASGQQGFSDGGTVCLYEYASESNSEDAAGTGDGAEDEGHSSDIRISCAKILQ